MNTHQLNRMKNLEKSKNPFTWNIRRLQFVEQNNLHYPKQRKINFHRHCGNIYKLMRKIKWLEASNEDFIIWLTNRLRVELWMFKYYIIWYFGLSKPSSSSCINVFEHHIQHLIYIFKCVIQIFQHNMFNNRGKINKNNKHIHYIVRNKDVMEERKSKHKKHAILTLSMLKKYGKTCQIIGKVNNLKCFLLRAPKLNK